MFRRAGTYLVQLLCLLTIVEAARGAEGSVCKTRLNGVDLWLDRETGSIVNLSSPATGVLLEATRERSGLLDVAYPVSEFTPLRLASRFSNMRAPMAVNRKVGWSPNADDSSLSRSSESRIPPAI